MEGESFLVTSGISRDGATVVGSERERPVVWRDGVPTLLPVPEGTARAVALAISPDGTMWGVDIERYVRNDPGAMLRWRGDRVERFDGPGAADGFILNSWDTDAEGRPIISTFDEIYRYDGDRWTRLLTGLGRVLHVSANGRWALYLADSDVGLQSVVVRLADGRSESHLATTGFVVDDEGTYYGQDGASAFRAPFGGTRVAMPEIAITALYESFVDVAADGTLLLRDVPPDESAGIAYRPGR